MGLLSPVNQSFLELFNSLVDGLLSSLDVDDAADLLIVESIRNRFGFQRCNLHQEVHASTLLSDKFLIARRLKNLSLHGQETDHETVHTLHEEIQIIELEAQEYFDVTLLEQVFILVVADLRLIRVGPDLSEAPNFNLFIFWNDWQLSDDLQDEVKDGPEEKISLDDGLHFPFFVFVVAPVDVLSIFKNIQFDL